MFLLLRGRLHIITRVFAALGLITLVHGALAKKPILLGPSGRPVEIALAVVFFVAAGCAELYYRRKARTQAAITSQRGSLM